MNIAILGATGVIGSAILERSPHHWTVNTLPKSEGFCISNPEQIMNSLKEISPDILLYLVNSYSISKYEDLNSDEYLIAHTHPSRLMSMLPDIGCKLIFVSTDQVFDGKRGYYSESALPNSESAFGKAKIHLEQVIEDSFESSLIVRTSAIYGVPNVRGNSFESWALSQLRSGKPVDGFSDVVFTPTYIQDFTNGLITLIDQNIGGIIHLSGTEVCSRYDFLKKLRQTLELKGIAAGKVNKGLRGDSYSAAFDTSLDSSKFWNLQKLEPTLLENGLTSMLERAH